MAEVWNWPWILLYTALGLLFLDFLYLQRYRLLWKGIPFLTPIPFFGSIKGILSMNMSLKELEKLFYKKYGRVYGHLQGKWVGLTVGDPDLIRLVTVKDAAIFLNRRALPGTDDVVRMSLFSSRDEQWKNIRSAVTPTFTSGKMRRMVVVINECAESLLLTMKEKARRREDVDIKRNIGAFTMDVICSTAFGIRVDSHRDPDNPIVKEASKLFTSESIRFLFPFIFAWPTAMTWLSKISFFRVFDSIYFQRLTAEVLRNRKKESAEERNKHVDFLQLMIDAQENLENEKLREQLDNGDDKNFQIVHKLTEDEIFAQCVAFFTVGFDTTATTISYALHCLALHPHYQERLYREVVEALQSTGGETTYEVLKKMPFLEAVVSETLRLYPAVAAIERVASEDYTLGDSGLEIRKGFSVFVPIAGIHFDPEFFPDPESFLPERFLPENRDSIRPFTYLPFGSGPRQCVALRFAQMEAMVGLSHLVRNFRFFPCARTKERVEEMKGQFLLQPRNMFLGVEERVPEIVVTNSQL